MMPQLLTVRVDRAGVRPRRFWVPVLPVLLVFLPVLVPAALVAFVACVALRVDLPRALGAGWRVVSALPGTRVDVSRGRSALAITIR